VTVRQRHRRATVASWQDYFAAAQWLDALCAAPAGRRGADEAGTDEASVRAELAEVRAELARQRGVLAGRGVLEATPAELAAARAEVSTDLASIRDALHECRKLILATDALLTRDRTRWWSPAAVRHRWHPGRAGGARRRLGGGLRRLGVAVRRAGAALRRRWSAAWRSRALRRSLAVLRRVGAAALRWSLTGARRALATAVRAGVALRGSPGAVRTALLVGCLVLVLALG
jgi:hypothetical protein